MSWDGANQVGNNFKVDGESPDPTVTWLPVVTLGYKMEVSDTLTVLGGVAIDSVGEDKGVDADNVAANATGGIVFGKVDMGLGEMGGVGFKAQYVYNCARIGQGANVGSLGAEVNYYYNITPVIETYGYARFTMAMNEAGETSPFFGINAEDGDGFKRVAVRVMGKYKMAPNFNLHFGLREIEYDMSKKGSMTVVNVDLATAEFIW
jgi:hypothetical protein